MSTQQLESTISLSYTEPVEEQSASQNGHIAETALSNGATIPAKMPPVFWQVSPTTYQNGTTPRGYVYLPDYEENLIPLQELKHKSWWPGTLPDHTQLPDSDGTFVKNLLEHPQSVLITTSIRPMLDRAQPDGRYKIGQDSGIYWRYQYGGEPLRGVEAPDWFFVPDVEPDLPKSYVLWRELVPPLIIVAFVSGDGQEERDQTPITGKFWVYETIIQPQYYAIYEEHLARVELYELINGQFQRVSANTRGHYPVAALDIELGIWHGTYGQATTDWLRIWDSAGNLLLTGEERAEVAEDEVARLQALLRQHGISG